MSQVAGYRMGSRRHPATDKKRLGPPALTVDDVSKLQFSVLGSRKLSNSETVMLGRVTVINPIL